MAEQEQYEIRNKRMLVVAGGLGLVCVVLFHLHDLQLRHANDQDMVWVLQTTQDLDVGDRITESAIEAVRFPRSMVPTKEFDQVVTEADKLAILGYQLSQKVEQHRILMWNYVSGGISENGNDLIPQIGYILISLDVNRRNTGEDSCPASVTAGSIIDLVTTIKGPQGPETVKLMERVLVKRVVGSAAAGRAISEITIETREDDGRKLISFKATGMPVGVWLRHPGDKNFTIVDDASKPLNRFNPKLEEWMKGWTGRR